MDPLAPALTVDRGSNIQQRVWDRMPVHPVPIPIAQLYTLLPEVVPTSIRRAMKALVARGLVELEPGSRHSYRRRAGALRPADDRGGARNGAGRRKTDHAG